MTADRAEIGLQVIANTLVGVDLIEQRKTSADGDYSVDGEVATISGRTIQALFLALRKRETENAVQSLVRLGTLLRLDGDMAGAREAFDRARSHPACTPVFAKAIEAKRAQV